MSPSPYLFCFMILVEALSAWGVARLVSTIGVLRHRTSKRAVWGWAIIYFLVMALLSNIVESSSEGGSRVIYGPFVVFVSIGGLSHVTTFVLRHKFPEAFNSAPSTTKDSNGTMRNMTRSNASGKTASPTPVSSGRVFISYRRSDSADISGRIYDRLVTRFGKDPIFKDVDSIPLGVDFKQHLDAKVRECNVILAIIGDRWIEASDNAGQKRLDDPADFVRIEIESALSKDIPVIPLLVRGAKMPVEESLPSSLRKLVYMNGIPIRPDPDFHHDMDRLISALEKYVQ